MRLVLFSFLPLFSREMVGFVLIGRTIKRADVFNKTSARFLFIIKINVVLCKDLLECLGISVKLIIFTELI